MKKFFNKVKVSLATLGVSVISFFSKVMGQQHFGLDEIQEAYGPSPIQPIYGVPSTDPSTESSTFVVTVIKIIQRLFIGVIFIVGIINLIRIKKTDDKTQKRERIKETIIFMSILIILIVACFITTWLLKK